MMRRNYKPFGYEFFNNSILSFRQEDINSIPSDYNIGAGDFIEIQLFGKKMQDTPLRLAEMELSNFQKLDQLMHSKRVLLLKILRI